MQKGGNASRTWLAARRRRVVEQGDETRRRKQEGEDKRRIETWAGFTFVWIRSASSSEDSKMRRVYACASACVMAESRWWMDGWMTMG
ncbi:Serine/threonine-protein kinase sid2 [Fusarium oxysporum f. sp. albedinis]|nr:Serine/threonine-protein kinase sid2 [Fusarium oxysporum f. sp. albedinis]